MEFAVLMLFVMWFNIDQFAVVHLPDLEIHLFPVKEGQLLNHHPHNQYPDLVTRTPVGIIQFVKKKEMWLYANANPTTLEIQGWAVDRNVCSIQTVPQIELAQITIAEIHVLEHVGLMQSVELIITYPPVNVFKAMKEIRFPCVRNMFHLHQSLPIHVNQIHVARTVNAEVYTIVLSALVTQVTLALHPTAAQNVLWTRTVPLTRLVVNKNVWILALVLVVKMQDVLFATIQPLALVLPVSVEIQQRFVPVFQMIPHQHQGILVNLRHVVIMRNVRIKETEQFVLASKASLDHHLTANRNVLLVPSVHLAELVSNTSVRIPVIQVLVELMQLAKLSTIFLYAHVPNRVSKGIHC